MDPLAARLGPDGLIGKLNIDFSQVISRTTGRPERFSFPLLSQTNTRVGHMTVRAFSIPPMAKTTPASQSMPVDFESCLAGLKAAEWHLNERKTGILTQMGGDCAVGFSLFCLF
jgi:hypothetical protein